MARKRYYQFCATLGGGGYVVSYTIKKQTSAIYTLYVANKLL